MLYPDDVQPDHEIMTATADEIMARYEAAVVRRAPMVPVWRDCYTYTLPEHAGYDDSVAPNLRARDTLFDGTAADAVDQLAASLLGNLTPPWGNWFGVIPGIGLSSEIHADISAAAELTTRVMQEEIDVSALAVELHQCFLDLVVAGTACLQIDPTAPGVVPGFVARAVPLSEVVLDEDGAGRLSRLYRRRRVTGRDLAMIVGDRTDSSQSNFLDSQDKQFDLIDFYEGDIVGGRAGLILIDAGDRPILIRYETGVESPYIAFRWMKMPGEVLGRSPVMKALPDIKTANKVVELVLKNASIAVTGIWQAEDDGVLNPATIDLVPGAIIPKAVGSAGLRPLEMPARFDVSQLVLADLRARIRHALLADRFAPVDGRNMTATEVLTRSSEVTLLLGAIYGRLQSELLTPMLTRIHALLRIRGSVPDLPLDGRVLALSHRSPLARAQAQHSMQPILALVDAVGRMGSAAVQSLNAPEVTRYLAEILGVPEGLMTRNDQIVTSDSTLTKGNSDV